MEAEITGFLQRMGKLHEFRASVFRPIQAWPDRVWERSLMGESSLF